MAGANTPSPTTTNANTVPADLQSRVPPSLSNVLHALKRDIFKNINCARVGVIQSFNAATQTAQVQIAQQQVVNVSTTGVRTIKEYPALVNVPVLFPSGGEYVLTFPISAGDECIIIFNDRELANWQLAGAGTAPTTGRCHDLSDGICIVGLRNAGRVLENVATDATQLRTVDGTTFMEVNGTGIKVHGATSYEWDVQGFGEKWTWLGGVTWQHDIYQTGAIINTINHPIAPPGPP